MVVTRKVLLGKCSFMARYGGCGGVRFARRYGVEPHHAIRHPADGAESFADALGVVRGEPRLPIQPRPHPGQGEMQQQAVEDFHGEACSAGCWCGKSTAAVVTRQGGAETDSCPLRIVVRIIMRMRTPISAISHAEPGGCRYSRARAPAKLAPCTKTTSAAPRSPTPA